MQEVFEIIEKLEERTSFLSDCTKYGNKDAEQQEKSYSTMMMYEVADLVDDLIEIVKHEAEQYEECYKHCGECEAYDKEKHHCPKFCKVIKETVKEIEENHNGWIPWSERMTEDGETYLVTNAESFGQCHTYKGWYDGKHKIWHMEENFERKMNVVAWQPLPQPYQPKGE